jgi:hypothetical protein
MRESQSHPNITINNNCYVRSHRNLWCEMITRRAKGELDREEHKYDLIKRGCEMDCIQKSKRCEKMRYNLPIISGRRLYLCRLAAV